MPNHQKSPRVLLVNPWITDFAAFDLWAKPIGLLMLGALLRDGGYRVEYVDCLDRFDQLEGSHQNRQLSPTFQKFGVGKYAKTPIPTPSPINDIPRRYYRYGIHPDRLREKLTSLEKPDMVWVTTSMTYWYPGVQETIRIIKEVFSGVEIWLGGLYARLCSEHASKYSGAHRVFDGTFEQVFWALPKRPSNPEAWKDFANTPAPAWDLVKDISYVPILTSLGCPFGCPYCATSFLQPRMQQRNPDTLFREISYWQKERGVEDFAFYDDALLVGAQNRIVPLLKLVQRSGLNVRFHTPNAVHIRSLTPDVCNLMHETGFTRLRLGLETTRKEHMEEWGSKVFMNDFYSAVDNLKSAGFRSEQIGVYLLCGLPGQSTEEVAKSIRQVSAAGVRPYLCEYSPIPHTRTFEGLDTRLRQRLIDEPLLHNNSYFACRRDDFTYDDLVELKKLSRTSRQDTP